VTLGFDDNRSLGVRETIGNGAALTLPMSLAARCCQKEIMGRPAKAQDLHKLQGTTPYQPPKSGSELAGGRAKIPAHLRRQERAEFKKLHGQLSERRVCTPGDAHVLALAAVAICRWIGEKKDLAENGRWKIITVLDSNGQPVQKEIPNPARKDSVESERQILSLLKSVGLTPDSKDRVRPAKNAVEEIDEAEEFLRQGDVIRFQRQE
jgi:P27 family predicted phage terminase small subunit